MKTEHLCRLLPLLCLVASGCSNSSRSDRAARGTDELGPTEILERMVEAYQTASGYSDRAVVRLRYAQQGQASQDTAPLSVTLARPNHARIHAYQTTVVCDGQNLYARIRDPETRNLGGQILVRQAPQRLTLDELFQDAVLHDALTRGLGRQPIQLELLLGDQPLPTLFADATIRRRLDSARVEDQMCYRVEAQTAEGGFVFWIDERTHVLRRLQYPVAALAPEIASAPDIHDAELVAEFRDAQLNRPQDAERFQFRWPQGALRVHRLVVPPQPLPTPLFGQRPGGFRFRRPSGQPLSQQSLSGRIAVLVWFNNHPACQASLQQLDQVFRRFQHRSDVEFAAVCTEPARSTDESLAELLAGWQVRLPLVRDLQAFGRDVFQIPWAPTLVVLDRQGNVQIFEVGANPRLAEQLAVVLDRLLAGEDLAAEIKARFAQQEAEYQRLLAAAQGDAETRPTAAHPPQRSEPAIVRLRKRWICEDAHQPGNLLAVEDRDGLRLYVNDGEREVVALDANGREVRRVELPVLSDRVSFLRTARAGDGRRRFVAAGLEGRAAYVLDEHWNLLFAYPPAAERHDGILDAHLGDLDGDGRLELLVGFARQLGVHAVSSSGNRVWSHESVPSVLSLAIPAAQAGPAAVLLTGEQGNIVGLDRRGQTVPQVAGSAEAVFHLFLDGFASAPSGPAYCGITLSQSGNFVAIGLDRQLRTRWSYPLPMGTYHAPIRFTTSADLLDGSYWVIAGPNGTVHLIRSDGQFSDHFACGETLTGIAAIRRGDESWIFTATRQRITAWTVER